MRPAGSSDFSHFFNLRKNHRMLKNSELMSEFAFAVDILDRLNELSLKLQGKGVFAHDLFAKVKYFQVKLQFYFFTF